MRFLLVILVVATIAGCATAPAIDDRVMSPAAPESRSEARWLRDLGGNELVELVAEAWRANPGIDAAMAAVERARAQAVISGAARYPELSLGLDGSRTRSLQLGSLRTFERYGLAADVSWVADLWGRVAARRRAGLADLAAASADARGVRLKLAADVARGWLRLREAVLQWRLAEEERRNVAVTLAVIEERYRAGLAEALDVYQAKENLATARAAEVAARQQLDARARVLETLLGRYPAGAYDDDVTLDDFPAPPPPGLDSRVLLRRPDIDVWRHRLLAAEARGDDAAKNRFPVFSLTARGGTQSARLGELLDWDNLVWSLAGGIVQPLFNGGRLRAEQALARAAERETLANYAQTVLTALREVQTALAAEPLLAERGRLQQEAVEMATTAAELSLENYRAGLIDVNALLTAQRRAYAARRALLATRLERLLNRVTLHLAIGGDFAPPGRYPQESSPQ